MTKEEAIKNLNTMVMATHIKDTPLGSLEDVRETCFMAIQALEQQPCEDAISREAVVEAIEDDTRNGMYSHFASDQDAQSFKKTIKALPSVIPIKTKGAWIGIDEEPHETWECDHCGFVIDCSGCVDPTEYRNTFKFCPNCGVDMRDEGGDK